MPPTVRDELQRAAEALGLGADAFRLLGPHEYRPVLKSIAEAFLNVGAEGLRYDWWWELFKDESSSWHTGDRSLAMLGKLLPPNEAMWLLANDSSKKQDSFWVCEVRADSIPQILGASHGFEYLVVSKKLEWLVGEHHSEVLVAVGERMIKALEKARHGAEA
jgi:hypothetical protein